MFGFVAHDLSHRVLEGVVVVEYGLEEISAENKREKKTVGRWWCWFSGRLVHVYKHTT